MDFKLNPKAYETIMLQARKKLKMACADLVTYIKTVKLAKGRRGQGDVLTAGEPPYSNYGILRNSVTQREKGGDPNTEQVGTPYFVGQVQELGKHISSAKLMTIPRSPEAIAHMNKPGATARTFNKKLVMIPSQGRTGVYFLVESKRGGKKNTKRSIIHFVLARNVNIPPHPWLVPSLTENGPSMMKIMGS